MKNAYWELAYAIESLKVQRQSLELAKQSLKDTETRVRIGTMAPIDIVEAEAEVAQRNGDLTRACSPTDAALAAAGNGTHEIRNWIVVASAAADLDVTWESYTPAYRTLAGTGTGLGFARWS